MSYYHWLGHEAEGIPVTVRRDLQYFRRAAHSVDWANIRNPYAFGAGYAPLPEHYGHDD